MGVATIPTSLAGVARLLTKAKAVTYARYPEIDEIHFAGRDHPADGYDVFFSYRPESYNNFASCTANDLASVLQDVGLPLHSCQEAEDPQRAAREAQAKFTKTTKIKIKRAPKWL